MRYLLTTAFLLTSGAAYAQGLQDVNTNGVDEGTTLGAVSQDAIAGVEGGGRDQGAHASGEPTPRDGLANAISDHDLSATIDAIDGD